MSLVPLKVPISPDVLFLGKRRKILLILGMKRYGFFDVLTDDSPEILHRGRLILEYSSICLLPDSPHEEAQNELPKEI